MPDLPEDRTPQEVSDVSIDIQFPSFDDTEVSAFADYYCTYRAHPRLSPVANVLLQEFNSSSLWEDPEQRSFYEDVTDIRPFIPAVSQACLLQE